MPAGECKQRKWRADPITSAQKCGIDSRRRQLRLPPVTSYPESKGEASDEINQLVNLLELQRSQTMHEMETVVDDYTSENFYTGQTPPWEEWIESIEAYRERIIDLGERKFGPFISIYDRGGFTPTQWVDKSLQEWYDRGKEVYEVLREMQIFFDYGVSAQYNDLNDPFLRYKGLPSRELKHTLI